MERFCKASADSAGKRGNGTVQRQHDSMKVEYQNVGTEGSTEGSQQVGQKQGVPSCFSSQPQANVNGDSGDDIADGRKKPHTADHSEGKRNHTLHPTHQGRTAKARNHRGSYHQKHQRKSSADAPGNMQRIRDDVCNRCRKAFGE